MNKTTRQGNPTADPAVESPGRPRCLPLYAVLYLLPLGLIFNLTGYLPPYLRLFFVFALLGLPLCLRPSRRAVYGALGLLGAMLVEALASLPPVADISLLLAAHQWVWAMTVPVPLAWTAGICFYGLLHFYLFLSPLGYPVIEALARLTGGISGWLTGGSFNLGPTYQNLGAFLLFLGLSVFGWKHSRLSKARTASYLAVAVLLNAFLSLVLIRQVDFGADLVWDLKYRDVFGYGQLLEKVRGLGVLVFPALVYLGCLLVYLVLHYETWKAEAGGEPALELDMQGVGKLRSRVSHKLQLGLTVGVGLVFVLLSMPPTAWRRPATSGVVFIERGVVSFTKPDYTRFGRAAGGMYGLLPEYVGLFGCKAEVVRDIPAQLDTNQIVVFTNLDEPLAPEVFRRLWDFVAAGGKLWVLGDHTFIKNGRNHINDLLAPCHIALKHDSAQFFPQGWFHSYAFLPGTPFGDLRDLAENRPAILVGASLALKPPAQPFILGRFGYSDWGVTVDEKNQGYIGDFKYQPQERLGDLVLVAGEKHGKGKVLVFGDTTSFFNNNLSRSFEILRAVLSWLGDSAGWQGFGGWLARVSAVVIVVGLGGWLWIFKPVQGIYGFLLATVLVSMAGHRPSGQLAYDRSVSRRRMAVIDFSHEPFASRHSSMDSGLHGVTINANRYGLLPIVINEWDRAALDASRLAVFNAPRKPFSRGERRDLTRFMQGGGTVVLGCGYPHYEFCRSLLEPLGLRIRGLPLGRFFDRTAFGQRVSFVSAWPIEVDNGEASVICLYDDWPLIVSVPVGQGRLVLIADSEFLHNRNLEGLENHDPANIQFMRSLFDYTIGGGGS